ncbi:MAG TPA: hypothetical protein VMB05_03520 [Solirubrobacteraceae bacterium]|nr:hypothetical protein [Solirubrobacteraceae bacterium]
MNIDRQAIERRDFPIARRGYEPAAVDAHLRALASEIEQLQRERGGGSEPSLASTAGTQVQGILAAAEAAAAEIEQQARESARRTRDDADRDAAQTREEAIEQARAHGAAVAQATSALLARVNGMDGEVGALVDSLRSGAGRLAADLEAVETNMAELYDAAAGQLVTRAVAKEAAQPAVPTPPSLNSPAPRASAAPTAADLPLPPPASGAAAPQIKPARTSPPPLSPADSADPDVHVDPEAPVPGPASEPAAPVTDSGDLDSARLVALNMALNGESRAEADRYLAENFKLADRAKLVDEVFAAIEG